MSYTGTPTTLVSIFGAMFINIRGLNTKRLGRHSNEFSWPAHNMHGFHLESETKYSRLPITLTFKLGKFKKVWSYREFRTNDRKLGEKKTKTKTKTKTNKNKNKTKRCLLFFYSCSVYFNEI